VLWVQGAQGCTRPASLGGPASQAGIHVNDIVLRLDGEEVLTSQQIEDHLSRRPPALTSCTTSSAPTRDGRSRSR
jgi:S1-C subfamily serine protease